MKNLSLLFFALIFIFATNDLFSQQSQNILQGRTYIKSSSSTNSSTLSFGNSSTGRSLSKTYVLGREVVTELSFTYKVSGSMLTIVYEDDLGTEEYTIDESSSKLVSTHLKGYVDGKWGKIYWTLK